MWSTSNTFGFGTFSLSLAKRFISTDLSPFSRYPNELNLALCPSVHIQAKLGQENLPRMVRWVRWHCPPDTGFEIQTLEVWGRARYLSVTEVPHNTEFHKWMRKKHFCCFFKPPRPGNEQPNTSVKGSGASHYPRAAAQQIYKFIDQRMLYRGKLVLKHWRSWMFRCCAMMRKRAYTASYTIEKVTRFVCLYQLYIQLHHVMSDDLDIFCLIVTCN